MTQIKKVEIHEFTHSVKNLGLLTNANTIGAVGYAKGQITKMDKYAIVVETDDGCRGEYVTHWGGNQAACAQSKMLAPKLLEYNAEEREKRAGKLIDQVTLKPGDLLYLPRGQYHDALASKNGAIHIAFGLTYFKPIDLFSILWEKFIVNDHMRQDIEKDVTNEALKNHLKKMSLEINTIINDPQNINIASQCIKNWPDKINNYSLNTIISKGKSYTIQKSIKIEINGHDKFLTNNKDRVLIPSNYVEITDFILKHEIVFEKDILDYFKHLKKHLVLECISNLLKMKVIN